MRAPDRVKLLTAIALEIQEAMESTEGGERGWAKRWGEDEETASATLSQLYSGIKNKSWASRRPVRFGNPMTHACTQAAKAGISWRKKRCSRTPMREEAGKQFAQEERGGRIPHQLGGKMALREMRPTTLHDVPIAMEGDTRMHHGPECKHQLRGSWGTLISPT